MYLLLQLSNHAAIELKFTNAKYDYNCKAIPMYKKKEETTKELLTDPELL